MRKQAALSSSSRGPPWAALPPELMANILQRLTIKDILLSAEVCSCWRSVCRDPSMWRSVDLETFQDNADGIIRDWPKIFRHIVNWSQGQLTSIKIGYFADDDLLFYIAQRAKQLRSLCICSQNISNEGFCKAVKEFPLLEQLNLFYYDISKEAIEAAGQSCPLLKSFSFTKHSRYLLLHMPSDEAALAVAVNMHGLKHLALDNNNITNEGLKAILDGCPHLESLDLVNCDFVILEGDLAKRCSQQIKDLKHRHDPIASVDDFSFYYHVCRELINDAIEDDFWFG